MYEIHVVALANAIHERRGKVSESVPSHGWNFVLMTLGNEFSHIDIKHADAIRVTFLRMTAKQLLSDTYSENRLAQVANHLVFP